MCAQRSSTLTTAVGFAVVPVTVPRTVNQPGAATRSAVTGSQVTSTRPVVPSLETASTCPGSAGSSPTPVSTATGLKSTTNFGGGTSYTPNSASPHSAPLGLA